MCHSLGICAISSGSGMLLFRYGDAISSAGDGLGPFFSEQILQHFLRSVTIEYGSSPIVNTPHSIFLSVEVACLAETTAERK